MPCKFTPLGFETEFNALNYTFMLRVNLPRWGLKPVYKRRYKPNYRRRVNLPRWGLKQAQA